MSIKTRKTIILLLFLNRYINIHAKLTPKNTATHFPLHFNVGSKREKFVNIIKEDLCQNNDDYADRVLHNISNPYLNSNLTCTFQHRKINTKSKEDHDQSYRKAQTGDNNLIKDLSRRAYTLNTKGAMTHGNVVEYILQDDKVKEFAERRIAPLTRNPKRFLKVTTEPQVATERSEHKIITNQCTKYIGQNKAKTILKFIKQKNSLLDKLINRNKIGGQTVAMRSRLSEAAAESVAVNHELAYPVPRAVQLNIQKKLPTGDQLDMAHAKGPRVHAMRIKGRLCHRSVLRPEGPKYDSKGNVYKSGFMIRSKGGIKRREFAHTRLPPLLLPRCCNCCKKSVLGCE